MYELNKKQEIIKSPIFRDEGKDINNNANNNFSYSPDNYLEFEDNSQNINKINIRWLYDWIKW